MQLQPTGGPSLYSVHYTRTFPCKWSDEWGNCESASLPHLTPPPSTGSPGQMSNHITNPLR